MLNLAILCIVCAVAYAFRGGTIFKTKWEARLEVLSVRIGKGIATDAEKAEAAELEKRWWPKKLRKPIYCIVTGAVFGLLAWDIWAGVIVALGSFLPPLTSPRPFYNSWRGADPREHTTINLLNSWMHWVANRYVKWRYHYSPDIAKQYTLDWYPEWSFIYGMCRGLYELPTTFALAIYYHNPVIALWGLLGGFMGLVYYASGKLVKDGATGVAECLYGALRGIMLAGVLVAL